MARFIALYLPQFHPIPENDRWWGVGFTEWRNVVEARSQFEGHYQPHLPQDLGFYDLRLAASRIAQAEMARQYGLSAFCYYYYWFDGRKILERPLEEVLRAGEPDFPLCLCWANENWTRRWDGGNSELLLEQTYAEGYETRLFADVLPLLSDARCLTIDGKPVFLVYRTELLPDPVQFANTWRRLALESGLPGIYLVRCEAFQQANPESLGFDAAYQFPPHAPGADFRVPAPADAPATLSAYDYRAACELFAGDQVSYTRFPGVMVSWDNTARQGERGHVFLNGGPDAFEAWLRRARTVADGHENADERLVFINAWNEWAEGCHLEPDRRHGVAYLEALRRVAEEGEECPVQSHRPEYSEVISSIDALAERLRRAERAGRALFEELRTSQRLPWGEGVVVRTYAEQWKSRSWTLTRPLRNALLRRRGVAGERSEVQVASDMEAVLGLLQLHGAFWWEVGAPLRIAMRIWRRLVKQGKAKAK